MAKATVVRLHVDTRDTHVDRSTKTGRHEPNDAASAAVRVPWGGRRARQCPT